MDENPETFQHSPSGDAGKPQDHSQQAKRVLWGESVQCWLGFHHELFIYCLNFPMRSLTGAGSVLRTLQILAWVLLSHGCQLSNV